MQTYWGAFSRDKRMDWEIDGSAAGRGACRSAHGAAVTQILRKAQGNCHGSDRDINIARTRPEPSIWRVRRCRGPVFCVPFLNWLCLTVSRQDRAHEVALTQRLQ